MQTPMKKTLAFTALFLWLFSSCLSSTTTAKEAPLAPQWTLQTQQGESLSLADYKGKPLVLHFWATWCPYCKKLQPGLDAMLQKYQSQGLNVVAISFREDDDATPGDVLKARGATYQTAVNGDMVAKQYSVRGTPTTFVIDADGRVQFVSNTSDPEDNELWRAVETQLVF